MQRLITKESSNIEEILYEEWASELRVKFRNGTSYAYESVSKEAWDKFSSAESKGKHFAASIRPRFKGRKV